MRGRLVPNQSRDSDASFASSLPSSAGMGGGRTSADVHTDRAHQQASIRAINAYLASHSFAFYLKSHPVSSVKDITETIRFVLSRLDFPISSKVEEDLFVVLKSLNCPYKVNKSTLRAPNSPHNWPHYLAIIHWLVQLVRYDEHCTSSSTSFLEKNSTYVYAMRCYLNFLRGDDDAEEALNRDFIEKLEREKESVAENIKALERDYGELAAKEESLRTGPTEREKFEKQRIVLEEDVRKFQLMVETYNEKVAAMNKALEDQEKELGTKEEERKMICVENEELKRTIELQTFNPRDMERMKRELQAVERDIGESEAARNAWEEKSWDLDATIGQKFKELESLSMECNQAIRRLKIDDRFQYLLNAKGSTPAEVIGIDYKSALKPVLKSYFDDINKSSIRLQKKKKKSCTVKLEDLIAIRQQSFEMTARIEGKRNQLVALESRINEMEANLNLLKNETEVYINRCAGEAKMMIETIQPESHSMEAAEREAAEVLKGSKMKLEEVAKQVEDEIQKRAYELLLLVDSVSKYKEHVESQISEIKNNLSETAAAVSDTYKHSLHSVFGSC